MIRSEWTHLDAILAEGARWLKDDVQPAGAIMTHHGEGAHAGGGLHVQFAPGGYTKNRKSRFERDKWAGDAVVIFDIDFAIDIHDLPYDQWDPYRPAPFTAEEFDALGDKLREYDLEWGARWNGPGCTTGSYQLLAGTCAPSLTATVAAYHESCPVHGHPFCSSHPEKKCNWYDGFKLLIEPQFVAVDKPAPPAPAPAIGNRNLEQVLAAIDRHASTAELLDVHAALVVPGRRGRVDDGDYVDEDGLGVTLPAEVYDRLMSIVAEADKLGLR